MQECTICDPWTCLEVVDGQEPADICFQMYAMPTPISASHLLSVKSRLDYSPHNILCLDFFHKDIVCSQNNFCVNLCFIVAMCDNSKYFSRWHDVPFHDFKMILEQRILIFHWFIINKSLVRFAFIQLLCRTTTCFSAWWKYAEINNFAAWIYN